MNDKPLFEYYLAMKKIIGLLLIALGIFLEVMWLGFCFGSIIIGILLLIFAPSILFFPFNFFLVLGLSIMSGKPYVRSSGFRYQQYTHNSGAHQNPYTQSASSLSKYYEELESKPSDDFSVIKKNYRRLIKEYHYDSIASKNLPEEMVKFAEKKTQDLNEAYAAIKEIKG
ncbi:J domain-containing protein [Sulfurimonas sp.]